MFYPVRKLQHRVRVDTPNSHFAQMHQQAIGGIKGEIRVCLQYLFQAWKDLLSLLIACDTMHQNPRLTVFEDLGGWQQVHPIPHSLPHSEEHQDFNYAVVSTQRDPESEPAQRWPAGPSIDGHGSFSFQPAAPLGDEPVLAPPVPAGDAQQEQMTGAWSADVDRSLAR